MRHFPERVENYTNAFLITLGLILFMVFFTMAATFGMVWVILTAAFLDSLYRLRRARVRSG